MSTREKRDFYQLRDIYWTQMRSGAMGQADDVNWTIKWRLVGSLIRRLFVFFNPHSDMCVTINAESSPIKMILRIMGCCVSDY